MNFGRQTSPIAPEGQHVAFFFTRAVLVNPHNTAINKETLKVRARNRLGKISSDTSLLPAIITNINAMPLAKTLRQVPTDMTGARTCSSQLYALLLL